MASAAETEALAENGECDWANEDVFPPDQMVPECGLHRAQMTSSMLYSSASSVPCSSTSVPDIVQFSDHAARSIQYSTAAVFGGTMVRPEADDWCPRRENARTASDVVHKVYYSVVYCISCSSHQ